MTDFDGEQVIEIDPGGEGAGRIRLVGFGAAVSAEGPSLMSWGADLPLAASSYDSAVAVPLRAGGAEGRRIVGAVYDRDGTLVVDSQRAKHNRAWKANPGELSASELTALSDPTPAATRPVLDLPGRTFFAGHRRDAFGHFLLETLPRLWPQLDYASFDTFLYYPTRVGRRDASDRLPAYAKALLDSLGAGGTRGLVVTEQPVRVEELVVSTPSFVLQTAYNRACADVFERAAIGLGAPSQTSGASGPRRIYLSRSRLGPPYRAATNEAAVEMLVRRLGFTLVHPQELPIGAQVALVRGADAIAGCDGSALHLAAFARPGTVLVAVDSRLVVNQLMIDQLAGVDAVHVLAHDGRHARRGSWVADMDRVRHAFDLAGLR